MRPLVGAGRRVARFAALATLEAACIHILAATEQRSEQADLFLDRGMAIDVRSPLRRIAHVRFLSAAARTSDQWATIMRRSL